MTTNNLGRWLLVALAIIGLAFAAPVVSAHGEEPADGNETAVDDGQPTGTVSEWATWMEGHMTDGMGQGTIEEMESRMGVSIEEMEAHMGVSIEEMTREMADGEHDESRMNGQGRGC